MDGRRGTRPEGPIGIKKSFFSDRMKTSSVVVDLETKLFRVNKSCLFLGSIRILIFDWKKGLSFFFLSMTHTDLNCMTHAVWVIQHDSHNFLPIKKTIISEIRSQGLFSTENQYKKVAISKVRTRNLSTTHFLMTLSTKFRQ